MSCKRKQSLSGKHVVITGASGGLGRALCRRLVSAGANVSALDIDGRNLATLMQEIPKQLQTHVLDISDPEAVSACFTCILSEVGEIDVLINNAGITHLSAFENTSLDVIDRIMQVNFMGAVNCTKQALPSIISRRGQIVVLSSVAGFAPLFGRTAYAASKYALHGFFETLRAEVKEKQVGVLMVCPSFIDSQRGNETGPAAFPGTERPGKARHVVGAQLSPEQVAKEIFAAVAGRKKLLLVGKVAKQSYWAIRLLPSLYERIMIRKMRAEVEAGNL